MHFLCSEMKSTHFYAKIAQNTSGTTLCNYMRVNKFSMQILPCVKRCFNIHHSFFPSGFLPMSRIQTNKQVSSFQKRKNAYWLVNNCHKTQETSEQQLKRMHISKQRHTNTRKAASPHTLPTRMTCSSELHTDREN